MVESTPKFRNPITATKKLLKKVIIFVLLQNLTLQADAKKITLSPKTSSTLLKLENGDEILTWKTSNSKLLLITKQGFLYSKSNSDLNSAQKVEKINENILLTNPVLNLHSTIDCWINEDKCVICGIGGCYTIQIALDNSQKFQKIFYNKKFLYKNTRDYTFDVKVLDNTNFFFVAENFESENSGGIIRYNSNSENCYSNWSPKLKESTGENQGYLLKVLKYTKFISAVNKNNGNIFIVDHTTMKNAIISDKKFASFISNFQDFDYFDGAHKSTAGFVVCGNNPEKLCGHVIIPIANGPTEPKDPAIICYFAIDNANVKVPAQNPVPNLVRVKVLPESNKHFIASFGKHLYFYGEEILPTIPPGVAGRIKIVSAYAEIEGTENILMIYDDVNLPNFLYSTKNEILTTSFIMLNSGLTKGECFVGCGGDNTIEKSCNHNFFRSQGCVVCKTGGTEEKYKASEYQNGAKCVLEFQIAYKQTVLGGEGSWNDNANTLRYNNNGDFCFNTTRDSNSKGKNPNEDLKARVSSSSSSLLVLWIILGIIGGLILIILIVYFLFGGKSGKGKLSDIEMEQIRRFIKQQILEFNSSFGGIASKGNLSYSRVEVNKGEMEEMRDEGNEEEYAFEEVNGGDTPF